MTSDPSAQTITVIGCGYVGLTTAVLLANSGYRVHAIEINPERLKAIQGGHSFFFEAGIDPLLQAALQSGALTVTDSYKTAVPESDIVFSCVGTPDNPDGSSNLTYVFEAASTAVALMKDGAVYAQKSTVPVGTGRKVLQVFQDEHKTAAYVSNPEFLREGTAIVDSLWPDRVVAGSDDQDSVQRVVDVYRAVEQRQNELAGLAGVAKPADPPEAHYIATALNSAELIKVTANAFLALKISFANSIAKLADQAGADIVEVMDAVGADKRIGRAFLNAGRGYGGGCFPKDVSGLIRSAEEYGVNMEIMHAASEVNDSMPHYIIAKAKAAAGGSFKDKKVAVLGLSFKAGTSDTRRSPAVAIANTLAAQGAQVVAHDPEAMEEARQELDPAIELAESLEATTQDADAIFIATDWPVYKQYDYAATGALIIDCMNVLSASRPENGYLGVGRN